MSITGGQADAGPGAAVSQLQRVRANAVAALALLTRAPRARAVFAWRASPLRVIAGVIVVSVAVLLTMAFVDSWAIVEARRLPLWLTRLFNEITDFGKSGWFLVPFGALLALIAVLAKPTLPRMTRLTITTIAIRLGFLFLAIGLPGLAVAIGKRLIGRARPLMDGSLDPFVFRIGWSPAYASLPSGHATHAFAVAVALGALWPKGRVLFWTYALVIALSRVVITAHHVSDVLAGAACGIVGALIVRDWYAARRLGFVPDGAGGVRALPGPSWARIKRVARQLAGP